MPTKRASGPYTLLGAYYDMVYGQSIIDLKYGPLIWAPTCFSLVGGVRHMGPCLVHSISCVCKDSRLGSHTEDLWF